jgi:DnaJ-class molecular chaperone
MDKEKCWNCRGTGKTPLSCSNCHGKGWPDWVEANGGPEARYNDLHEQCACCGGTGKVEGECSSCRGSGERTLRSSGARGQIQVIVHPIE